MMAWGRRRRRIAEAEALLRTVEEGGVRRCEDAIRDLQGAVRRLEDVQRDTARDVKSAQRYLQHAKRRGR